MQKSPHLLAGTELYRPLCSELQQFRVLTILPGSETEELQCHLCTASLEHDLLPLYETISYAWGDRNDRASILVNTVALNVPQSTKAALHCMRSTTKERNVWIDAVCINQNDILERSAQVAIMAKIYMHGIGNLVFLGNDEEGVAEGTVAGLVRIHQDVTQAMGNLSSKAQMNVDAGEIPLDWNFDSIIETVDLAVYERLYHLPWFR